MSVQFALMLMDLIPRMLAGSAKAIAYFNEGKTALETMVKERRDPTPDEWAALQKSINEMTDELERD
jgi:HAMP domain-containing protein